MALSLLYDLLGSTTPPAVAACAVLGFCGVVGFLVQVRTQKPV